MRKFSLGVKLLAVLVAFWFLWAGVAVADELYARIRGVATDATGAVVPDVQVTATNIGTNISRQVTTGSDGSFEFLNLPIGDYKVAAAKSGFKRFETSGITLVVNQIYVLSVKRSEEHTSELQSRPHLVCR